MIEPPSAYEMAVTEAVAAVQGTQALVFCAEHAGEVGVIRHTPRGRLFMADVPVESGSGVAKWRRYLREESGSRPPPGLYQVRVLIDWTDWMDEVSDLPKAWCDRGQHRLEHLKDVDFQSHSGRLRVKPV